MKLSEKIYAGLLGVKYSENDKHLISIPNRKNLEKYTIPEGVNYININAAENNEYLKHIEFASTVKIIDYDAFANSEVREIIFNEGLERIGSAAFNGSKIEKIYLPSTLRKIGIGAFSNCENLKEVEVPIHLLPWAKQELKHKNIEIKVYATEELINKYSEEIISKIAQNSSYLSEDIEKEIANYTAIKNKVLEYIKENKLLNDNTIKMLQVSDDYLKYMQVIIDDRFVNETISQIKRETIDADLSTMEQIYIYMYNEGRTETQICKELLNYTISKYNINKNENENEINSLRLKILELKDEVDMCSILPVYRGREVLNLINEFVVREQYLNAKAQIKINIDTNKNIFNGISYGFLETEIDSAKLFAIDYAANKYNLKSAFVLELKEFINEHTVSKHASHIVIQDNIREFETKLKSIIDVATKKINIEINNTDAIPQSLRDSNEIKQTLLTYIKTNIPCIGKEELIFLNESLQNDNSDDFYKHVKVVVDICKEAELEKLNDQKEIDSFLRMMKEFQEVIEDNEQKLKLGRENAAMIRREIDPNFENARNLETPAVLEF